MQSMKTNMTGALFFKTLKFFRIPHRGPGKSNERDAYSVVELKVRKEMDRVQRTISYNTGGFPAQKNPI